MYEYKVYYHEGNKLGIGDDWFQTISAETPQQAYRKFIQGVGVFSEIVYVEDKAFLGGLIEFNNHCKTDTQDGVGEKNKSIETEIPNKDIKKYDCEYQNPSTLDYGVEWKKNITASSHKEAYHKFLEEVGIYPRAVLVGTGLFAKNVLFEDHIAAAKEKEKKEKADALRKQKEADKQKKLKQLKSSVEFGDISVETTTEKILLNIAFNQEKQFNELRKLNSKLWSFWIFFIGLPILAWIIITANS
jgi:hypothetical protein